MMMPRLMESQAIIRHFESNFPETIRCILQGKNIYSEGVNAFSSYMMPIAKGRYFAFCEGDDYWIDRYKLQKQYDYLESNFDCSALYHNCILINENGEPFPNAKKIYKLLPECDYSLFDFAARDYYPGQLASSMFRRSVFGDHGEKYSKVGWIRTGGDDSRFALLALTAGRVHVQSDVMSAHRVVTTGDSYTARTCNRNMSGKEFTSLVDFKRAAKLLTKSYYPNNYKIFHAGIAVMVKRLLDPCFENRNAFSEAVSSVGGARAFFRILLVMGITGIPLEIAKKLFRAA